MLEAIDGGNNSKSSRRAVIAAPREAKLDERRIADMPGPKTLSTVLCCSPSANLAARNREAMATLASRKRAAGAECQVARKKRQAKTERQFRLKANNTISEI